MGYMNNDGLLYFWTKLKTIFVRTVNGNGPDPNGNVSVPVPSASSTSPKMDGTATVGSETAYARGDHVHPKDTSKANLASPTFTGTPSAPTAAAGTNTTQIATTAFVQTALSKAVHGNGRVFHGTTATAAGTTAKVVTCADFASTDLVYGTILVLEFDNANSATAPTLNVNNTGAKEAYWFWGTSVVAFGKMSSLANHPYIFVYDGTRWLTEYSAVASSTSPSQDGTATVGTENAFARGDHRHPTDTTRAPLASPALTGTPTAPTPTSTSGDTQIATKKYVDDAFGGIILPNASDANPNMDGTASPGTGAAYSRWDHVHPVDTSRAPLASPTLTGTPKAPTAAFNKNDTQIATTAFVHGVVDQALSGTAAYKGALNSNADLNNVLAIKPGWYWSVTTAGTYLGQDCEVGDFIFANSSHTKASASAQWDASYFDIIQSNITPMTNTEIDTIVAS